MPVPMPNSLRKKNAEYPHSLNQAGDEGVRDLLLVLGIVLAVLESHAVQREKGERN